MKLLLVVSFFALCISSFGQTKSLLYEVKKNGHQTSYLYGTIHLVPDSLFLFTKKLKKIISQSDEIIFEIVNFEDRQLIADLILQKDKNTFDLFTDSQKDSIITWGSQITEIDSELFQKIYDQLKPFNLLLLTNMEAMKDNVVMVDTELITFADEQRVFKSELESIAVQFSLFDQLPDSSMREMILNEMRQTKKDEQLKSELYHLYQSQDIEGLAKLINESEDNSAFTDTFIFQRNIKWLPIIIEKMLNKSCFVAVGAGHLGGNSGLIQLLKQEGFSVTPILF
jgi:uncharacterized protein YbaP (TraB family)